MFSSPQFALPQLLYAKYHGCFLSRAFRSAPLAEQRLHQLEMRRLLGLDRLRLRDSATAAPTAC